MIASGDNYILDMVGWLKISDSAIELKLILVKLSLSMFGFIKDVSKCTVDTLDETLLSKSVVYNFPIEKALIF
jgi:hypothetical protein